MKKSYFKVVCIVFLFTFFVTSCYSENKNSDIKKLESYKYMKTLNSVFDYIQQNYVDEIDPKVLYEGAIKGMMDSIQDPYSVYLDTDQMRGLMDTAQGSFGGIGVYISKRIVSTPENPAYVEISSPMENTPGARAGLQAGDKIIAIEGEATPDLTSDEVLDRLRGEPGTPVTITILRGKNIKFDVKIFREIIEVPTIKHAMIEGTSIGYVRLIQFTPDTPKRLQDAIDSFEKENFKSLIIDLRDNGGGLLSSAVEIADKFIDEGPIVSTKGRSVFGNESYYATVEKTTVKEKIPVIVLINHGSASASEILAGALKDKHIAYLIGERSYGKGSVQHLSRLGTSDSMEGIKLTMARYYSPSDTNIDKIGIPPDLEIHNVQIAPEQEQIFADLYNSKKLSDFLNMTLTEKEIAEEAEKLAKEYPLDKRLLRRLIRVQLLNSNDIVYDYDYDLQLKKAIEVINNQDFDNLLKNTKTLKQLQEEAVKAEEDKENAEKESEKIVGKNQ